MELEAIVTFVMWTLTRWPAVPSKMNIATLFAVAIVMFLVSPIVIKL